jgi:two-component system, cell cycle response regulator
MTSTVIRVLLIEDNPGDARLIQIVLQYMTAPAFNIQLAGSLASGLERLDCGGIDVVLLDLSLPDSQGLDTFARVHKHAPQVPTIVLTGLDDETLATRAMQEGAQDYLVKGQVDGNLLVRAMRYAIERQRLMDELRALSLVDELTGLYNRRGFLTLAQQQLKIADRAKRGIFLLFLDLDHMKWINDSLGHAQGDRALIETASVLTQSFRDSDIVARVGGDEFAVVAMEDNPMAGSTIYARLQEYLQALNSAPDREYSLSLSVGIACYDPDWPCSIDELLARADASMYEQKRRKGRRQDRFEAVESRAN